MTAYSSFVFNLPKKLQYLYELRSVYEIDFYQNYETGDLNLTFNNYTYFNLAFQALEILANSDYVFEELVKIPKTPLNINNYTLKLIFKKIESSSADSINFDYSYHVI